MKKYCNPTMFKKDNQIFSFQYFKQSSANQKAPCTKQFFAFMASGEVFIGTSLTK